MLLDHERTDSKEFIEEFSKRFSNFCRKAPLLLSFQASIDGVSIFNFSTEETIHFDFDFFQSVKDNIHQIKIELVESQYPILIEEVVNKVKEDLSTEEIQQKIDRGEDTDEVLLSEKITTQRIKWRIERVIVRRDEFFVRNMVTNELFRFKSEKMPSTLFLKRFREKKNPVRAWQIFQSITQLIEKVEEVEN